MSSTDQPVNANKALWEKGDFTRVAASMRESGTALVRALGVRRGMDVLDLACGDGTTAVPEAQLGANVLGVDIARNLVAAGEARAQSLGLGNLKFQEGDAGDLGELADDSCDLVLIMFGAMFAPRPDAVARETVRVTRPGGRVVMGNWIPNDPTFVAQLLRISTAYSPPPEGFVSPMLWGVEEKVVERFTAAGVPAGRITCEPDVFTFQYDGTPSQFLAEFRDYYGPTMNAYAAAAAAGRQSELHAELEELVHDQNTSGSEAVTTIPAAFLMVTVEVGAPCRSRA
jgi:SAM-dependent methyltransferase